LLGIKSDEELLNHYLRGGLFESFILSELIKYEYNRGQRPQIYFWRDNHGHEIDCIIEKGQKLVPIEIKAGKTINTGFFDELKYWNEISKTKPKDNFLIYSGEENQIRSTGGVLGWKSIDKIFSGK